MAHLQQELSWFNPEFGRNRFIHSNIPWIIICSYLVFVKVVGPIIMKVREPLDLKQLILRYNLLMVAVNAGLFYTCGHHLVELWPYQCDFQKGPVFTNRERFLFAGWYFLLVKYVELLDTVFFILRGKSNQASFLHVFHHGIMCFLITLCVKYNTISYYQFLIATVNSGIHVLLYSYYALSAAVSPVTMRKYLWWKRLLTTLQIVQFFVYLVYMLYSNLIGCGFKFQGFDIVVFFFTIAITALFLNFYFRTYK